MTEHAEGITRRHAIQGAAWSVPLIALAVATPLAAASTVTDVGAFNLVAACDIPPGGPGFTLVAGPVDLPAGTVITITGTGMANLGSLSIAGGAVSVDESAPTTRVITLTAPLAAGASLSMRADLSPATDYQLTGATTLPAGYDSTTATYNGSVINTDGTCTAE
ncbi:hypothetical protein [Microbacterium sp. p3-SID336]|uniref:hypothetical protein n=1 Tax=Microbacterium sp. p3-SID336 TaxID=2916212 RepID=UPI0021A38501|nr:hypothetical protein [Microbacterium sp. p3-SID336]MCT1476778.1 hypothetical protein [Microbacterium sp. p3-SID336]